MKRGGLGEVQRQWDAWGRKDPFWAALTRTDKWDGSWDPTEFMRSGREEIDFVLGHLAELGLEVPRHRALDFGCGVGRFTQALAETFERADGVDIAPSTLAKAHMLDRHDGRCVYHLNEREDGPFPPGTPTHHPQKG